MMPEIVMKTERFVNGTYRQRGDAVDVDDGTANALFAAGDAIPADEPSGLGAAPANRAVTGGQKR